MTFTTIPGAGATDATSFVGTDGVDVLVTFNTLTAFVGAQGASDRITAGNIAGQVDWQVKGGSGNDTITFQTDMLGGRVNGNAGADRILMAGVFGDAAVFGGQNNDEIFVGNVANSRINGNLGADDIRGGDLLQASIFGGQQNDLITFAGDLQSSIVDGNIGNDRITLSANATGAGSSVFDMTVRGGLGDDVINAEGVDGTGAGLDIAAGEGDDITLGSQRNDTMNGGAGDDQLWGESGADEMTGGTGANVFGYGYDNGAAVPTATYTVDDAAAESITGSATNPTATDIITDWDGDDALAIRGIAGFTQGGLFDSLKDAMAAAGAVDTVVSVGVGSAATGYTSYALIYGTSAAAAAGAVRLGAENVFNNDPASTGFVLNNITAAQVVDPTALFPVI